MRKRIRKGSTFFRTSQTRPTLVNYPGRLLPDNSPSQFQTGFGYWGRIDILPGSDGNTARSYTAYMSTAWFTRMPAGYIVLLMCLLVILLASFVLRQLPGYLQPGDQHRVAVDRWLLLRADKLFDSETGRFIANQEVLIKNDRIVGVGRKLSLPNPAQTEVVALQGCTITPGLIDVHTHLLLLLTDQQADLSTDALTISDSLRLARGLQIAHSYLKAGITTIRDLGNSGPYLDLQLRKLSATRPGLAPDMLVSGPILSPPGGQFGKLVPEDSFIIEKEYRVIRSVADARKAVEEHLARGVDVIKVCVNTDRGLLPQEQISAIVETAHLQHVPVTAHATYDAAIRAAVLAGVDGIEHGYQVSDSTLAVMARKGVYLVPTDPSYHQAEKLVAGIGKTGAEARQMVDEYITAVRERLLRAYQKKVRIVAGADYYVQLDVSQGEGAKDVLLAYQEAGLPVGVVLQAATLHAAKVAARPDIGVIKKGAKADLVIFQGDLEKDFRHTLFSVKLVLKAGRKMD